jgi:hypothetical protein
MDWSGSQVSGGGGIELDRFSDSNEVIDFSRPHNPRNPHHTGESCTKLVQLIQRHIHFSAMPVTRPLEYAIGKRWATAD